MLPVKGLSLQLLTHLLCEWLNKILSVWDTLSEDRCLDARNHKCDVLVLVVGKR